MRAILHQRISRYFIEVLRRTESGEYQKRRFMCGVFGGVYVHREVGLRVADSNGAVKLKDERVTRELFSTTVKHRQILDAFDSKI